MRPVPRQPEDLLARFVRQRIEEWLRETGESAASLARLAHISPAHVSDLRGGTRRPGLKTLKGIALALGYDGLADLEQAAQDAAGGRPHRSVAPPRLRSIEGWERAAAEAKRRFKHISPETIDAVGELIATKPPKRISPEWIADLAHVWAKAINHEDH